MYKIFVIIFIFSNVLFAQLKGLPEFFNLDGYKTLKFGMNIEEVNNKITNYNTDLYADFHQEIQLNEKTVLNIYKNPDDKLAYYLYFYNDYLYRIEVCNHIGYSYNKNDFYYPSEAADIEDIKEKITFKYGDSSYTDIKYYSYYNKPFEEYTIWWYSDLSSVSLYVKPDLNSLDKTIKLYSYRLSFYDETKLKEIYK
ncbi:hypothetical protein WESB_1106 [Brachyspira pilosicoli WesB]|uniref:Uncharacterized protein n=1 Tax=Brachyspira pilosicoli WesB TaxID=1161918 RepID=K0JJX2_BRAPL|nr:hypothetical protein [Brachyspira pilosicoli]CCG56575.1 hypothetical protein WESB_1106 [Brachyspira pilosicoli WesB]